MFCICSCTGEDDTRRGVAWAGIRVQRDAWLRRHYDPDPVMNARTHHGGPRPVVPLVSYTDCARDHPWNHVIRCDGLELYYRVVLLPGPRFELRYSVVEGERVVSRRESWSSLFIFLARRAAPPFQERQDTNFTDHLRRRMAIGVIRNLPIVPRT